VHQVGFYYTDVSRCTVNRTLKKIIKRACKTVNYKIKLITNTNADQKNKLHNMKHQILSGHKQTR